MVVDILKSVKQYYISGIEKLSYLLFLIAVFCMAMPCNVLRVVWTAWAVAWLLEFRFLAWRNIVHKRYNWAYYLFGVYMAWQALSCLWSVDVAISGRMLEKQLSFVLLPLVALFGLNKNYKASTIAIAFVSGVGGATVFYAGAVALLDNYLPLLQDKPMVWATYVEHFDFMFGCLKHRFLYANAVMVASVVLVYYYSTLKRYWGQFYTVLFVLFFFATTMAVVYLTGSRASVLTYLGVMLVLVFDICWRKRNVWLPLLAVVAVCVAVGVFCRFHPRMQSLGVDDIRMMHQVENGREPRLAIWYTATQHLSEYWLTGKGVGGSVPFLREKFEAQGYPKLFCEHNFHSHNQYLEFLLDSGIVALVLFCAALCMLVAFATPQVRRLAFYLLLIFVLNFFTDTVVRVFEGVALLSFVAIFLWLRNREYEEEEIL